MRARRGARPDGSPGGRRSPGALRPLPRERPVALRWGADRSVAQVEAALPVPRGRAGVRARARRCSVLSRGGRTARAGAAGCRLAPSCGLPLEPTLDLGEIRTPLGGGGGPGSGRPGGTSRRCHGDALSAPSAVGSRAGGRSRSARVRRALSPYRSASPAFTRGPRRAPSRRPGSLGRPRSSNVFAPATRPHFSPGPAWLGVPRGRPAPGRLDDMTGARFLPRDLPRRGAGVPCVPRLVLRSEIPAPEWLHTDARTRRGIAP